MTPGRSGNQPEVRVATRLTQLYPNLMGQSEPESGERRLILKRRDILPEHASWRDLRRMDLIGPGTGFPVRTMHTFVAEIEPGRRTQMHRHFNEAIILILAGRGHSIIDGQRVDWEEGDFLCIPVFAWHQHFNDGDQTVRYLGIVNVPLMEALGVWRIEERVGSNKD